jgi:acetate kinase
MTEEGMTENVNEHTQGHLLGAADIRRIAADAGISPTKKFGQNFVIDPGTVRRIVREIGALVAVLGGLDMLVFTAGVGEHNAFIRERICAALGFLGIALDTDANARHAAKISSDHSQVIVAVEPTNEEWIAASHALSCLDREKAR